MEDFDNFKQFELRLDYILNNFGSTRPSDLPNSTSNSYIENFVIGVFHSIYYQFYDIQYLKSKASNIKSKHLKAWVEFCIDIMPSYHEDQNEEFLNDLECWCDKLNLSYDTLSKLFEPWMPIISSYDIQKYAYNHLNNRGSDYFFVLFLIFYQYDIPEPYNKDDDVTEELYDFQRDVIFSFIFNAPSEQKGNALMYIFKTFSIINKTEVLPTKFSLSIDKILYGGKNALDGKFFLCWDKVEFYNGFYLLYHPAFPTGKDGHGPYRIDDPISRVAFNDVSALFRKRLPPILVSAQKGKIREVHNLANLNSCITIIEKKVTTPVDYIQKDPITPQKKKEIVCRDRAKELVKGLKSRFLDYLCAQHLDTYNVVCCVENRVNSNNNTNIEFSFIFTIKETPTLLYLAFENSLESRCTYIFPIPKDRWQEGVDAIYNFFASNEANKRQSLSRRIIDLKLPGNYSYIRVLHTDYCKWTSRIEQCK